MLLTDYGQTWKHAMVEVAKKNLSYLPMLDPDILANIIDNMQCIVLKLFLFIYFSFGYNY